jgi:sulfur-carrier protein
VALSVLYFAWVRERIGLGEESVDPPAEVRTVADLIGWLAARGGGHAEAFADIGRIRAALDGRHVALEAPLAGARELSLFPPVTGG